MPPAEPEIVRRHAVRALLVTPQHELLLARLVNPSTGQQWWVAPGGGLEPGECEAEGLVRELFEETGLRDPPIGPRVWLREHRFAWQQRILHQTEAFYWVPVPRFDAHDRHQADAAEKRVQRELRWWSYGALRDSDEDFAPRRLAEALADLLAGRFPNPPLDVGV